ncbi:hypothetical protein M405DRAFT_869310 [Rhizopogon salebrosus TDB-379]|nr:hypothetical protein M405DRAFT_869310 [Rhizopogon salebrosus TDB-379]
MSFSCWLLLSSTKLNINQTTQYISLHVTRTIQLIILLVSPARTQLNDPNICKGTSVFATQDESNCLVATRPCRSGTTKPYAPDYSDGAESSPSDSDWAASEDKHKKVACLSAYNDNDDGGHGPPLASPPQLSAKEKGKDRARAVDDDDEWGDEGEDDPEDDPKDGEDDGEDEDEDRSTKHDKGSAKKGRLPQEAVSKVQELGRKTVAAVEVIGKEYGKSARTILIEAGLARKAIRKESTWNQHQAWYGTAFPASEEPDFKTWQAKQYAHYKAHPSKEPKHAKLCKEIQEYCTHSSAGTTEHLSSRSASSMMMRVHDDFSTSASFWFRTHGVHIAGVMIFPGDEESGRQASGFFSGSDIMKDIINAQQLNIQHYLDELTTILRYKDLEAAQAEGKTLGLLLPSSTTVPNGTLLCNGKSARDRNRRVAPMIIGEKFAEAGHPLKTSNSRWLTMLDTLYAEKLCIHDWPAGVPPPGPDFDLKALSASQLRALVVPYLRRHLGVMYEADLGKEDEDDDTEAEAAKMKKRKSKSKKSNNTRRTKDYVESFESESTSMYLIPLVIDTDGLVLRVLQDSEKFFKDFPPEKASQLPAKKKVLKAPLSSNQGALRLTTGASCLTMGAVHLTTGASCSTNWDGATHLTTGAARSTNEALRLANRASRSTTGAARSANWDGALGSATGTVRSTNGASGINCRAPSSLHEASRLRQPTNQHIYQDLPPSSPPTPSSVILSPPVSCPSSPVQGSCNSDSARPPNLQHKRAHHAGQRQHGHDARHLLPYGSDTRKRTRDEYETMREADDMESKMVKRRHKSRLHDNEYAAL